MGTNQIATQIFKNAFCLLALNFIGSLALAGVFVAGGNPNDPCEYIRNRVGNLSCHSPILPGGQHPGQQTNVSIEWKVLEQPENGCTSGMKLTAKNFGLAIDIDQLNVNFGGFAPLTLKSADEAVSLNVDVSKASPNYEYSSKLTVQGKPEIDLVCIFGNQ